MCSTTRGSRSRTSRRTRWRSSASSSTRSRRRTSARATSERSAPQPFGQSFPLQGHGKPLSGWKSLGVPSVAIVDALGVTAYRRVEESWKAHVPVRRVGGGRRACAPAHRDVKGRRSA
ncbi:protein of unknown function [Streptantibioticus cattleyicolor NRRL 8057 = DSM 46488]|nr:protein of unknown function [Streptantibioticus cattleyicolor NRRL 8057 = DSM 46488]